MWSVAIVVLASCATAHANAHAEAVFDLLQGGQQMEPLRQDQESRDRLVANLERVSKYDLDSIESGMILYLERSRAFGIRVDHAETKMSILNRFVFDVPSRELGELRVEHGKPVLGTVALQSSGPVITAITEFRSWRKTHKRRKTWR